MKQSTHNYGESRKDIDDRRRLIDCANRALNAHGSNTNIRAMDTNSIPLGHMVFPDNSVQVERVFGGWMLTYHGAGTKRVKLFEKPKPFPAAYMACHEITKLLKEHGLL